MVFHNPLSGSSTATLVRSSPGIFPPNFDEAGVDPVVFRRRGRQPSRGRRHHTIEFWSKLHKIKKILVRWEGGCAPGAPPWIRHCEGFEKKLVTWRIRSRLDLALKSRISYSVAGQRGRPLRTKFFLISCSFWENLYAGVPAWRVGLPLLG